MHQGAEQEFMNRCMDISFQNEQEGFPRNDPLEMSRQFTQDESLVFRDTQNLIMLDKSSRENTSRTVSDRSSNALSGRSGLPSDGTRNSRGTGENGSQASQRAFGTILTENDMESRNATMSQPIKPLAKGSSEQTILNPNILLTLAEKLKISERNDIDPLQFQKSVELLLGLIPQ